MKFYTRQNTYSCFLILLNYGILNCICPKKSILHKKVLPVKFLFPKLNIIKGYCKKMLVRYWRATGWLAKCRRYLFGLWILAEGQCTFKTFSYVTKLYLMSLCSLNDVFLIAFIKKWGSRNYKLPFRNGLNKRNVSCTRWNKLPVINFWQIGFNLVSVIAHLNL